MLVIPVFLSQATRRGGRQIGGDRVSLHCWRKALGVEGLLVVVLKRDWLKERDIAATAAGRLGGGHGLPGDGPRWVHKCLSFGTPKALGVWRV